VHSKGGATSAGQNNNMGDERRQRNDFFLASNGKLLSSHKARSLDTLRASFVEVPIKKPPFWEEVT
jgi:hypothetical protein